MEKSAISAAFSENAITKTITSASKIMNAAQVKISAKLDSSDKRVLKVKNASAEKSETTMFGTSKYKMLSQPSQKFFFKKNPIIP